MLKRRWTSRQRWQFEAGWILVVTAGSILNSCFLDLDTTDVLIGSVLAIIVFIVLAARMFSRRQRRDSERARKVSRGQLRRGRMKHRYGHPVMMGVLATFAAYVLLRFAVDMFSPALTDAYPSFLSRFVPYEKAAFLLDPKQANVAC